MLADLTGFFGIYLFLLLLTFVPGFYILRLLKGIVSKPGSYTGFFLSLLFGLIFIATVFSMVRAHFLTVCLFFPLVGVLTFYGKKISFSSPVTDAEKKPPLIFYLKNILFVFIPFLYFALIVFKGGGFQYNALAYDNVTYAGLSQHLAETGIENKWIMFFTDPSFVQGTEPYHYVDSWINAFAFYVFGCNPLLLFYLVTYPLLFTLILSGILAVMEQFGKPATRHLALALLLVFIGPVFQVKNLDFHYNSLAAEIPLQHFGEKFSIYYPFIFLSILLSIHNYLKEALLWLLSLCIVSSTVFPAVFFFSFLLTVFYFKEKKELLLKLGIFFSLYIAFYLVFKLSSSSYGNSTKLVGFTDLDTQNFDLPWLKIALSNFFYGFIQSFGYFFMSYFYLAALLIYFCFFKKDKTGKKLMVFLLLILCGLLPACIFYKMADGHQLFTNTLPLLHCITISLLIIIVFRTENRLIKNGVVALIFFFALNTVLCSYKEYKQLNNSAGVSDAYLLKAKKLVAKEHLNERVGFIYNQADHDSLLLNPGSNYLYHLSYLGLNVFPFKMASGVGNTLMSAIEKKAGSEIMERELYHTFSQRKENAGLCNDSLSRRFIQANHLNYLLIGPSTSVPGFLQFTRYKMVTDPKTHLKFIKLPGSQGHSL